MLSSGALDGIEHSRCIQADISEPTEAATAFNASGTNDICLVAVPLGAACCCQLAVNVPSGYICLYQKWYKNQGQMDPGVKFCWPFYYRVSHVVNAATITYSAPSRQVPTADNVMVDINLSLTFAIGPGAEAAEAFVYTLGVSRFDEFLSSEVEEGIRGLVYSVTHDRVNDLREEFAQGMLGSLSRKFLPYGVQIKNVKITDVALPRTLAVNLEQTTTFRTRIAEIAKKHENSIRVLQDEAAQQLEAIIRTNARRKQDLLAQCQRYEIEHKEIIDEVVGTTRVNEIETQSKMDVAIASARGSLEVATAEGQKEAEEVVRRAEIAAKKKMVEVDQRANVIVLQSESELRAAENNSQAVIASAEAENTAAPQLEVARKYELEWERLSVLETLAGSGRRLVSGTTGSSLLKEMVPSEKTFKKAAKEYF